MMTKLLNIGFEHIVTFLCFIHFTIYSRIQDNQFSGKIPDFIQSWTSLTKLYKLSFSILFIYFNSISIALNLILLKLLIEFTLTESLKGVD